MCKSAQNLVGLWVSPCPPRPFCAVWDLAAFPLCIWGKARATPTQDCCRQLARVCSPHTVSKPRSPPPSHCLCRGKRLETAPRRTQVPSLMTQALMEDRSVHGPVTGAHSRYPSLGGISTAPLLQHQSCAGSLTWAFLPFFLCSLRLISSLVLEGTQSNRAQARAGLQGPSGGAGKQHFPALPSPGTRMEGILLPPTLLCSCWPSTQCWGLCSS